MFEHLYERPIVRNHHAASPLVEERITYLRHLEGRGAAKRRYATLPATSWLLPSDSTLPIARASRFQSRRSNNRPPSGLRGLAGIRQAHPRGRTSSFMQGNGLTSSVGLCRRLRYRGSTSLLQSKSRSSPRICVPRRAYRLPRFGPGAGSCIAFWRSSPPPTVCQTLPSGRSMSCC